MNKNNNKIISRNNIRAKLSPNLLQFCADVISVSLSYMLLYYIRFISGWFETAPYIEISQVILTGSVFVVYWLMILGLAGMYKNWYIRSPFDELYTVFKVAFFGSFFLIFIIFLDEGQIDTRGLFMIFLAVFGVVVSTGRYIARKTHTALRKRGLYVIPAMIVGSPLKVRELHSSIIKATNWGYKTVSVSLKCDSSKQYEEEKKYYENMGVECLLMSDSLEKTMDDLRPSEVLISLESDDHGILLDVVSKCAERNIGVKIIPDLYDYFTGRVRTLHLYGIPLIEVNTQLLKTWQEALKKVLDVVFSALVLILGSPVWLLLAIIVKLDSPGPVFYKQERVGKNGRLFMMFKYRSMKQDAEKGGPRWTSVNDTRVTKFGKFLRSSHLDEVPQFLNVLIGEMSLVGPRPERPVFVDKFSEMIPYYKRRLVVRPGITGWWQVKYTTYVESKEEIENRLKDDFFYIENMSLKLDFEIIVRTVFLVLKGHGQT
jgi:exopolysaccharide biosynthesis polyprenyl glycosylphosphotransferase